MMMVKIGVILHDEAGDPEDIGEWLADFVYNSLKNGEDFLETEYLGCEKL